MPTEWPTYLAWHGERLIDNGFRIVPIKPGEKYPKGLKDWERLIADRTHLQGWLSNGRAHDGVGILAEYTPAVDIDVYEEALSCAMADWIDANVGIGKLRIGQAPKRLLAFRAAYPFPKTFSGAYWIRGQFVPGEFDTAGAPKKLLCKVEVLGAGQQFVAHAIHPGTQKPYEWIDGDLLETRWEQLDTLSHDQAKLICAQFDAMAQTYVNAGLWELDKAGNYHGAAQSVGAGVHGFDALDIKLPRDDVTEESIREMLQLPGIVARMTDRDQWVQLGMALSHQFSGGHEGLELWREVSATAHNFSGDHDIEYRYGTYKNDKTARAATIALLLRWVKEDQENVVKFRLVNLEAGLAKFTTYSEVDAGHGLRDVKNFLKDNPSYVDHLATILKTKTGAPRIDTLKKEIRPSAPARHVVVEGGVMGVEGGDYERDPKTGAILATQGNANLFVRLGSYARFAFDLFQMQILVSLPGLDWRPLEDDDYPLLLTHMERIGFVNMSKEKIKDAVSIVAKENKFDSAIAWLNGLTWDGVPRVATFLWDYAGVEHTAYSQAVSYYMFTGMAARVLVPGIKLDMVPILVSEEGLLKSSLVKSLAPSDLVFGELDMSRKDEDISRTIKGKLILEWPELKGLKGKDEDSIKAFFTQQFQEWVPKYKEQPVAYKRRCFVIGTANDRGVLPSYGKARRWLPLSVGKKALAEAAFHSHAQLWAEGAVLFRQHGGVMWEEADRLAPSEREDYREDDPVYHALDAWLRMPLIQNNEIYGAPIANGGQAGAQVLQGDVPFKSNTLVEHLRALRYPVNTSKLYDALRKLGYDNPSRRYPDIEGTDRRWIKKVTASLL